MKACDQAILMVISRVNSLKIGVDRGISPIRFREGAQGDSPSKGTVGFHSETSELVFFIVNLLISN
jgi:hypothetical protein